MREKVNFGFGIVWVLVGAVLFGLGAGEVIDNFWSGMGGGLIGVGLVRVVRHIRYRKDAEYREKTDTEVKDERNKLIEGILVVVFKLLGREDLMMMASYNVCGIVLMYWICWLVLRKKY